MQMVSAACVHGGRKLAVLTLCVAASGCATVAPTVPHDISRTGIASEVRSAGPLYQQLRDGQFEVGDYRVTGIRHGVYRENQLSIGLYSQSSAAGRFQFSVDGPRSAWLGRCNRQSWSRSITLSRVDVGFGKNGLLCELRSGDQRASLELNDVNGSVGGHVQVGTDIYDLRQYFHVDAETGKFHVPGVLGLRIDRGGQNAGALALVHPEAFWFNASLAPDRRDALAAALAALLIDARRY